MVSYHESLPFVYEQTDFTKINTAVYVFTYLYLYFSKSENKRTGFLAFLSI